MKKAELRRGPPRGGLRVMSASGPKRTCVAALHGSALGGKADIAFVGGMSVYDPERTLEPIATRRPVAKC